METKTLYRLIEEETPLYPHIAAETVIARHYTKNKIEANSEQENRQYFDLIEYLANKANDMYNLNSFFKRQIRKRGNEGRDNLYMFMEHWLEAKLLSDKKRKNENLIKS